MTEKINLLQPSTDNDAEPHFKYREIRTKISLKKKIFIYIIAFIAIFITTSIGAILSDTNNQQGNLFSNLEKLNFFSQLPKFLSSDVETIKGYEEDRVNILLLGMGGGEHDGPLLTDTIILTSYQPSTGKIAMLSFPRDLLVEISGEWRKINNVNALAEIKQAGSGSQAVAQTISKITGLPIHYYARIDFAIFQQAVDEVGGLDIYVDRAFTDYSYPADNYAYQTISFKNGWQHMDGSTALKYVRSRHGNNNEGSDFARSRRQQKIISALSKKILSLDTILSPKKINNLLIAYHQNIQTNMEIWEALVLKKNIKDLDNVINQVLDTSPENYLTENMVNGAYVLQTKTGDWSDIQYLAENIFNPQLTVKEFAKIEVLNGTNLEGLALNTSLFLQNSGYDIIRTRNATQTDYSATTIYDLTNGTKPKTIKGLKQKLKATVSTQIPVWIEKWRGDEWEGENKIFTKADIIVVTGSNIEKYITQQVNWLNRFQEQKKPSDQKITEVKK